MSLFGISNSELYVGRLRESRGIRDDGLDVHFAEITAVEALLNVKGFAAWMTERIHPPFVVEKPRRPRKR